MNNLRRWEYAFCVWVLLLFPGTVTGILVHPDVWPRASKIVEWVLVIPTSLMIAWLFSRSLHRFSELLQHWGLLAMLAFALLSCAWSVAPLHTLAGGFRLAAATAFAFYFARRFSLSEILDVVLTSLIITLVLSYVLALVFPSLGAALIRDHPNAWRGVFLDKNALGFAVALSIVSGTLGLLDARLRWESALLLALALPLMVLSHSAGAMLVTCAGFFGILVVISYHRLRSFGGRLVWSGAVLSFVLALGSNRGSRILIRLLNRDMSLTTRAEIWVRVLSWADRRPLLGHGYRAFWIVAQQSIERQLKASPGEILAPGYPGHSHNGLLETFADQGLIGLLLLIIVVLWTFYMTLRTSARERLSYWPLALVCAVVAHNFTEVSFLQTRGAAGLGWILFLVAAVFARASKV